LIQQELSSQKSHAREGTSGRRTGTGWPNLEPPSSIDEGEKKRIQLLEDIEDINLQLGTNNPKNPREPDERYLSWRKKALVALRIKRREYRQLLQWIKENNRKITTSSKDDLLKTAYSIINGMKEDQVELNEDEEKYLNQLNMYLCTNPSR
jgi:hypothetical protein